MGDTRTFRSKDKNISDLYVNLRTYFIRNLFILFSKVGRLNGLTI